MTHMERRASPLREGAIGVVTGAVYGIAHTVSGHPLDNIKAAMQLDRSMHGLSSFAVVREMWRRDSAQAFFRGVIPPLWGSAVYRSVMISSYEGAYTAFDKRLPADSFWKQGLVRPMVVASAVFCSLCRILVEAPIEQAKVSRQTGQPIVIANLYRGAMAQAVRTTGMLLLIFVPYDIARRKSELFRSLAGQFVVVTGCCAFSYAVNWPLETLKNLAQAGLPRPGATLAESVRYLGGPRGLYFGALPGIICGGFRNGVAMLAMNGIANPLVTWLGLRD